MLESIQDLIAGVGDRLTPTERRIAEVVVEDPTVLAFGTVSDLASRAETSHPSIVRFATKLGFDGYTHLQQWAQEGVAEQLSTPSQRIRHERGGHAAVHREIEDSIRATLELLDATRLEKLTGPLIGARSIRVISGETSRAGAIVLQSGLSMVRDHVHLVEDHHLGRDLSSARRGDAAVVFDFSRYRRSTILAARAFVERGVDLVAITDGPLSPLASMTDNWCALRVPAVGPFDSSVPAVVVAERLVQEVAARLGTAARERIDRLERQWSATRTFWDQSC